MVSKKKRNKKQQNSRRVSYIHAGAIWMEGGREEGRLRSLSPALSHTKSVTVSCMENVPRTDRTTLRVAWSTARMYPGRCRVRSSNRFTFTRSSSGMPQCLKEASCVCGGGYSYHAWP